MHYQRLKVIGTLAQPIATAPDADRFWVKVDRSGGPDACWPWLAKTEREGYGRVWWKGRSELSHRVSYELTLGAIPDGAHLDHLCRTRYCVNPQHLDPVTMAENIARGQSPSATNARRTHCVNGHEFTAENTYHPPKQPRSRYCIACARQRSQDYAARRRSSTAA